MAAQNFKVKNGLTVGTHEIIDSSGNIIAPGNITVSGTLSQSGGATYATETYVDTAVSNVQVDLTGYATEIYVGTAVLGKADAASLSTVATSGLYSDLTGTPTIPADVADLTDIGGLLTHFSGSYTDLTNKPSIPANTSDLTNDSGFITSSSLTGYATETYVTTAISNVVDNAPTNLNTLNKLAVSIGNDGNFANSINNVLSQKADVSLLSTIATTGLYSDIIGAPTNVSSFTNDAGYLTSYTETDTLDTITGRGATTTNNITIGNIIAEDGSFGGNVIIDGDLTVSGTTTTINATNLAVSDNMIYLNDGSTLANPDIGIAGNYNDGTYQHTGLFRDASDGKWKFFDQYIPEPDEAVYIDTGHASFHLAPVVASSFEGDGSGLTNLDYSNISNAPTLFSGSYLDLTNTPSIPSLTSDLTNDSGFITSSALTGYATETYVDNSISAYENSVNSVLALKVDSSSLSTVATTGSYNDLLNKPTLFSGSYLDLTNTPTLFSGSYNDLLNKPTLFSGSYLDLTNKPTIPTATSQLTNDSGFITSSALTGYATETYVDNAVANVSVDLTGYATETYVTTAISGKVDSSSLSTVATTGSYADLLNKPTLFSGSYLDLTNTPTLFSGSYLDLTNTPTLFSGSYLDLTNKPTIPAATSDLTNDSGFITSSALTGYATETYVNAAVGNIIDAAPAALDTLNELAAALGDDANFASTVSNELANKQATLVSGYNIKTINGASILGSGDIVISGTGGGIALTDLSVTTASSGLASLTYNNTTGVFTFTPPDLSSYAVSSSLATVATTGSYNDLTNTPTLFSGSYLDLTNTPTLFSGSYLDLTNTPSIPSLTSDLTNDSGFITSSALTGYATETYVDNGLSAKQATLVSGTNIKTINGTSILGSGDITISGGGGGATQVIYNQTYTANVGDTTFAITYSNLVEVYVNGIKLASDQYTATSGTDIVLLVAAEQDDVIDLIGFLDFDTITYDSYNTITVGGLISNGYSSFKSSQDKISVLNASSGTVVHDTSNGPIFYHTNPSANFTPNFTNVPTTNEYTTVMVVFIAQGATPYIPIETTTIKINGSDVTVLWSGATAPTGNANQTDMVSFSLMRIADSWIVLANTSTFA